MLHVRKRRFKPRRRRRVRHRPETSLPVQPCKKQSIPVTDPALLEGTMETDPVLDGSFTVDSDSVPPVTDYTMREHNARPSRTKRSWSDEEDLMLIDIMVELHGTGRYKADRGFKPGLYAALEKEFAVRCPGAGIRVDPHIYSRVKTMKAHYDIVSEMLNTSGFGWDPERNCVTAEDAVWNDYIRTHKSAAQFRGKTFKFLDQLTILFGTDRANGLSGLAHGVAGQTSSQSVRNDHEDGGGFQGSENNPSQSVEQSGAPPQSSGSGVISGGRKRKSMTNSDADSRATVAHLLMDRLMLVADKMCEAVKYTPLENKQENLMDDLRAIGGLSATDRFEAHAIIWPDPYKLQLFYSLKDDEKEAWVMRQVLRR